MFDNLWWKIHSTDFILYFRTAVGKKWWHHFASIKLMHGNTLGGAEWSGFKREVSKKKKISLRSFQCIKQFNVMFPKTRFPLCGLHDLTLRGVMLQVLFDYRGEMLMALKCFKYPCVHSPWRRPAVNRGICCFCTCGLWSWLTDWASAYISFKVGLIQLGVYMSFASRWKC